ncbi:heparan sulfate glucosamine 3-O-sulfotransferase 1-like [Saccoglossus kowalevskii]|uniref:Heparan sulfate glucosamine 3-O-sulfotransferase 2-like n=1 Tax=Saccoglossus kowalevskii TaxID=10224 RepID=A0ABM0GVM4_SACKO|nr:PREDICTED: heparan sulfate glucosamine 3-O-sulfotransferase 2-like [Saccoglossus kowalevskii]
MPGKRMGNQVQWESQVHNIADGDQMSLDAVSPYLLRRQPDVSQNRTVNIKPLKAAPPPKLPSNAGSNLTAYIKAKFGNSCYKEESFSRWWRSYFSLEDEMLMDNNTGCSRSISDVYIVGVKKCATDAIRDLMAIHPYIMYSRTRTQEIHFYDRHFDEGYGWYRRQFGFSKEWQVVLEKTPQTFSFPEDAPRKMAELNPQTKIIMILCDPVVRAISDYVHELKVKSYKKINPPYYRINRQSFELSVFKEPGKVDVDNELINMGMYSKHMKRWLEYFPKTQIHVVDGNDFKLDPVSEIQKIEIFLGLPNFLQKSHLEFRPPKLFCVTFPNSRCPRTKKKGREHPEVPYEVLNKLYEFYRPYDNELQHLLNKTFSWMR